MLINHCREITKYQRKRLNDHQMGRRIMCPEYSLDKIDIKTFPDNQKDIFVMCWNIEEEGELYATIKPSPQEFAYYCQYKYGDRTQHHTHDYIELAYVVEGEFKQRIMGNDILFKKGELCLIDKNCPHQDILIHHNSTILFIGLANEIFDKVMVDNIGEEKILRFLQMALMKQKDISQYLHFKPKDQEEQKLEELLLYLLKELECNDAASGHICKGLMIRILRYLSTIYDFKLSNEQRKKMNWLIYEEITKFIEANYSSITIKDLVRKFNFNEDYYNRLLKDKTGMTYSEYVQNIRLTNAYDMLKVTNLSIETIVDRVGYKNKGYFYKIFYDKFKTTPAKIRKGE